VDADSVMVTVTVDGGRLVSDGPQNKNPRIDCLPVDPSGQTSVTSAIKIISMPTQVSHWGLGTGYFAEVLLQYCLQLCHCPLFTYQPCPILPGSRYLLRPKHSRV
jgi:hypothetical protein